MTTTTLTCSAVSDERDVRDSIDVSTLELTKVGIEYHTDLGYIDILTTDVETLPVPIEVKFGEAGDRAIGQILGYMKAVGAQRGFIIARSFSKRVKAISNEMNVELVRYVLGTADEDHLVSDQLHKYKFHKSLLPSTQMTSLSDDLLEYIEDLERDFTPNKTKKLKYQTFNPLEGGCNYISSGDLHCYSETVYYALRHIGSLYRIKCIKMGTPDELSKMRLLHGRYLGESAKYPSYFYSYLNYHIENIGIFQVDGMDMPNCEKIHHLNTCDFYRPSNPEIDAIKREAKQCGVIPSDLCLFDVLVGLKGLVDTDSKYHQLKDSDMFADCMHVLEIAIRRIALKNTMMKQMMSE